MFSIKKAVKKDLNRVFEIESKTFDTMDCFSKNQIRYLLSSSRAVQFICISKSQNDQAVGYCSLLWRINSRNARLYSLAVLPNFREKKIASSFLKKILSYMKTINKKILTCEVRVDNKIAIQFYLRNNFKIKETVSNYYTDGCSAYRMKKEL